MACRKCNGNGTSIDNGVTKAMCPIAGVAVMIKINSYLECLSLGFDQWNMCPTCDPLKEAPD